MTGWMIYNIEDYNKNKKYFEMHKEIADKNDIKLELKFMENFSYGVNSHSEYFILYDNYFNDGTSTGQYCSTFLFDE